MFIADINIKKFDNYWKLEATVLSANRKYCGYIVYYSDTTRWYSDNYTILDSIKKMCRKAWYKKAKEAGISRKVLNVMI